MLPSLTSETVLENKAVRAQTTDCFNLFFTEAIVVLVCVLVTEKQR